MVNDDLEVIPEALPLAGRGRVSVCGRPRVGSSSVGMLRHSLILRRNLWFGQRERALVWVADDG